MQSLYRTITGLLLVFTSTLSFTSKAQLYDYSSSCDASVKAELTFYDEQLTIITANDEEIKINANGDTWINGQILSLTSRQQRKTKAYYAEVERLIPRVFDIASEAVKLAQDTLYEVFGTLFGNRSEFVLELDEALDELHLEIKSAFQDEKGKIVLNPDMLSLDGDFSNSIDSRIDELFSDFAAEAIGEAVTLFMKNLFSSDGSVDDLEKRFANFEDDLEQRIETQVEGLEEEADALCESFKSLDYIERDLNKIGGFEDLNLIQFGQRA